MKPERERPRHVSPANATVAHRHARDLRRMSNMFALAGAVVLILELAEVEPRQWLQTLVSTPIPLGVLILAFLMRRAAFKIYRIQAGMPVSELDHFQAKRAQAEPSLPPHRKVAPLPPHALDTRDQLLGSGVSQGARKLSSAERSENARRHQRPALLLAAGLLADALLLGFLIVYEAPVFVAWISMGLLGWLSPFLFVHVQRLMARSVRVVVRDDQSWTEFLVKKTWSINGEPAEWRFK